MYTGISSLSVAVSCLKKTGSLKFSPADLMSIAAFASLAFTPLTSRNMTFDAGLAVRLSMVADLQSQRLLAFPTYKQEFGRIMNYYSPVPAAPAFVEVAVTSYTQVCYSNISFSSSLFRKLMFVCVLLCMLAELRVSFWFLVAIIQSKLHGMYCDTP